MWRGEQLLSILRDEQQSFTDQQLANKQCRAVGSRGISFCVDVLGAIYRLFLTLPTT
jgi:hypothetical protein